MKKLLAAALLLVLVACSSTPSSDLALTSQGSASCDSRVNNTFNKLLECVTLDGVRAHQAAFQTHADANGGNRFAGLPGHEASVSYVAGKLRAAGYNVTVQPFDYLAFKVLGPATLEQVSPTPVSYVQNTDYALLDQTDPGNVTAPVTAVDLQLGLGNTSSSGCEAADFAGFPAGHIALIQRGSCTFEQKAENAAAAGAVGVVIFNQGNTADRTGLISGTLGATYTGGIPGLFTTYARGVEWASTPGLVLHMVTNVLRATNTTYNVLAETKTGDTNNVIMVGAHLDSVLEGPGINDNGSGSATILETALQMAKVNPRNKVRFAWWSAEESGLVGSTFYVNSLSEADLAKITLYLNFDMVGSPNYARFIYDGDNSDGVGAGAGPDGSAQIEKVFESFYASKGLAFEGTDFDGRSDYRAFILAGIPAGGLFTGAEGIKTPVQVALYGGTAGVAYDACYHQACDTFANNNNEILDVNADAIAYATLQYAMNTASINGVKGKGNFKIDRAGSDFVR